MNSLLSKARYCN